MHEKLQEIIEKYPEALSNRQKLRALLLDYFPDKKRESNILLMVFDEDIIVEMRKITSIDNILMMRYIKKLVINYGIYEEVAKEGILNWARAFGVEVNLLDNLQKIEYTETNKAFCQEKLIQEMEDKLVNKCNGMVGKFGMDVNKIDEQTLFLKAEKAKKLIKRKHIMLEISNINRQFERTKGFTKVYNSFCKSNRREVLPPTKIEAMRIYLIQYKGMPTISFEDFYVEIIRKSERQQ
ncbi:hypothetical protein C8E03_104166 [Lachnotalea glycerini]|uniref:Uncharacterized protein n=1 Tax=Lachnotalea glycerini TaxID=1763509 RepID=A0A255I6E2_9FIRM|nr:hypothetical protein [Lachnotalea glycerini]PXV91158.1 hypothetical protein C8E03_104166 [Lachnotalea glycerini]RDY28851.1 hypothetical protein CG710_019085 [Lachnotalea glycerini]